ncbi:MAG: outer membrane protein assembly factor BamA, partial [Rhodocyclaceae bacterium]|nr:outer membrane protein assembly factor BamA [Rhodocyclaceae bacterium]
LVQFKPGDVYNGLVVNNTVRRFQDKFGSYGFAFARIEPQPQIDRDKKQANIVFVADPGRRAYVRRINISGNTRTRDEVVRREIRQMEGSWYDGEKINKSRARVDKLGYFDEVTIETPAVPGTTDQVDVNVTVKEKPTGNLMLGAGLSSSEGLVFSGSVNQQNLFGSGKHVGVGFNTSRINKLYSFSYTDPYYTIDGISRGFDVYYKDTNTQSLTVASYGTKSFGGGVRYGFPIGEEDFINFGLAYDSTHIRTWANSPARFMQYNGKTYGGVIGTLGWAKDTLDSRIYPMKGYLARIGGEVAVGSTMKYYRANAQYQQYFPLTREYALMINGELALADALGGGEMPFYKYYYAGGVGSVRGYRPGSIGPIDTTTEDRLGGTRRFVGNAEFLFPMPGGGQDKSLRLGAFFDAGKIWGTPGAFRGDDGFRYSVGMSLAWTSPMGPLKFSLAQPLAKKTGDLTQRLQFQMGTIF